MHAQKADIIYIWTIFKDKFTTDIVQYMIITSSNCPTLTHQKKVLYVVIMNVELPKVNTPKESTLCS
jgi:hypothetical protein